MESVTLVFLDSMIGNQVVPNLLITVYEEDGINLVTYGRTGPDGTVELLAPVGNYVVRTFKIGVTPTEETLTVEIGGGSFTFYVSTILVAPPPSPRVCRLFSNFVSLNGRPWVQFRLQVSNMFDPKAAEGLAVVENTLTLETDAAGHVEFDVVRGARIRVTFITTPFSREIVVPDKAVENLMTALGESTDNFRVVRR